MQRLFTLYHEVERWLGGLGRRVPEDVGLVQFEWRADHVGWAGMDQRNDLVGEAAVDMLVSMLHAGVAGVPEHPLATMVSSQWVDGGTVRGGGTSNAQRPTLNIERERVC